MPYLRCERVDHASEASTPEIVRRLNDRQMARATKLESSRSVENEFAGATRRPHSFRYTPGNRYFG